MSRKTRIEVLKVPSPREGHRNNEGEGCGEIAVSDHPVIIKTCFVHCRLNFAKHLASTTQRCSNFNENNHKSILLGISCTYVSHQLGGYDIRYYNGNSRRLLSCRLAVTYPATVNFSSISPLYQAVYRACFPNSNIHTCFVPH